MAASCRNRIMGAEWADHCIPLHRDRSSPAPLDMIYHPVPAMILSIYQLYLRVGNQIARIAPRLARHRSYLWHNQSVMSDSENAPTGHGQFTSTHWSIVLEAGNQSAPAAQEALERLCRA